MNEYNATYYNIYVPFALVLVLKLRKWLRIDLSTRAKFTENY